MSDAPKPGQRFKTEGEILAEKKAEADRLKQGIIGEHRPFFERVSRGQNRPKQ